VYLCVLPFHPNEYTMSHFIKYDFRFIEQVQMFLFMFGSSIALVVYASAQEIKNFESWFDEESGSMGTQRAR